MGFDVQPIGFRYQARQTYQVEQVEVLDLGLGQLALVSHFRKVHSQGLAAKGADQVFGSPRSC